MKCQIITGSFIITHMCDVSILQYVYVANECTTVITVVGELMNARIRQSNSTFDWGLEGGGGAE